MDLQITLFFAGVAGILFYLRKRNKALSNIPVTAKIDPHIVTAHPDEQIYEAKTVKPVSANAIHLVGIGSEYYGNRIPLTHEIILGRDPSLAQLIFTANEVSRRHLRLKLEPPFVFIEDLGSSNGSAISLNAADWQPLKQIRIPISQIHGVTLRLGNGNLKFRLEHP